MHKSAINSLYKGRETDAYYLVLLPLEYTFLFEAPYNMQSPNTPRQYITFYRM